MNKPAGTYVCILVIDYDPKRVVPEVVKHRFSKRVAHDMQGLAMSMELINNLRALAE